MNKTLCIIGNSVTLRVRPHIKNEPEKVYSAQLQDLLPEKWDVIKYGKSRYLSSELVEDIDDYINYGSDIYVLNIGCVDAPPRDIPKWYSDIIFKRKWLKLYPIFNGLYRIISTLGVRKYLVYLRKGKPWVTIEAFKKNMKYAIDKIKENTKAEVIIIGINKGSERLEKHLPGILNNYAKYNNFLEELCYNRDLKFLDVQDLNHKEHFPDGVHYNELGHKIIAKRILGKINE